MQQKLIVGPFRLEQWDDYEDDNVKTFHFIYGPGLPERGHFLDWTPYEHMGLVDFQLVVWFYMVEGRFPSRDDKERGGALRHGDMEDLVREVIAA